MEKLTIDYSNFKSKFTLDDNYDQYFDKDGMMIEKLPLEKGELDYLKFP